MRHARRRVHPDAPVGDDGRRSSVSRLGAWLRISRHLLGRIPAIAREGRALRHPRDLVPRLRRAVRNAAARAGSFEPSFPPRTRPRAPGVRRVLLVSHNLNLEGAPIFQHLLARGSAVP